MSEGDRYIPGVPCWADTTQPDSDAAGEFYAGLFGWELENIMPPDAPGKYLNARLPGGDVGAISSQPEGAPPGAAWNTYVWVDDADETARKAREAGGTVLQEPFDIFDSGRMATFADPEGAVISVWQPKEHRGAGVVNEHGSVNVNPLSTGDIEAAAAFYGAVFGWEVLDVGGASMWALPGYGDFLESRMPGMRKNMAEMGAPERFEDVVASVAPGAGEPPHWGITFGVNDADAAAARAKELGGEILVEPFDAPWTRMTIVRDPQGATFTASQFKPENKDLGQ